jgi:hypothetical protein
MPAIRFRLFQSPWQRLLLAIGVGLVVGTLGAAWLVKGPVLLRVQAPTSDQTVGVEGVQVLVRFDLARTRPPTFRALLNGADVTRELEVADNGAHGSLHGLLEGDNELRFEIYGTGYWPDDLVVLETRSFRIRFRPPLQHHRG